jgi:alanyl-tRNA synthetase
VEALVGTDAFRFLARESVLVSQLTEQLKARREELPERIAALVARLRDAERDLERLRSAQLLSAADGLAGDAEDVSGVAFVAHRVPDGTVADGIRKLALDVRGRLPAPRPGVVMIAGLPADRPTVVITVNEAARARGLAAGALVRTAAAILGGGGGGRDDIAQGGGAPLGDNTARAIEDAFGAVRAVVRDMTRSGGVP